MKILSNNIYWLQGYPSASNAPDPAKPSVLKELINIYQQINPDIVCLQEIQDQKTFEMLRDALHKSGVYCPGNNFPSYGGACFATTVNTLNNSSMNKDNSDRFWLMAQLASGPKTFTLMTLHLPSNLSRDHESATQKRQEELNSILHDHTPDIICGDFNQRPNNQLSEFMDSHSYCDAAVITNNQDLSSCPKTGTRIDHFWVKKEHAHKINSLSNVAPMHFRSHAEDRMYISDHLPIILDIDL